MHLPATLNIAKLTNSSRAARIIAILRSTDEINIVFCPQYLLWDVFDAFSRMLSLFFDFFLKEKGEHAKNVTLIVAVP